MHYRKKNCLLAGCFLFIFNTFAQIEAKPALPVSAEVSFGEIQNAPATNEKEVTETATEPNDPLAPVLENLKAEEVTVDPRIKRVLEEQTFFFDLDFNLLQGTVVEDLGVKDLKTLESSIVDAWKKLIAREIPIFKNLEIYNDLDFKNVEQNSKNVLLLFKVSFKKLPKASIVGKMNLQINASYVLQKLNNKNIISTFDYPQIERSLDLSNTKELSSNVASLIYNLLNAKTQEIASNLKTEDQNIFQNQFEIGIKNVKGLIDLTKLNTLLGNVAKSNQEKCKIDSKIKSFSPNSPMILLSSSCDQSILFDILKQLKDLPFDNSRQVQFLPDQKTFEIFTQALHNDTKENITP